MNDLDLFKQSVNYVISHQVGHIQVEESIFGVLLPSQTITDITYHARNSVRHQYKNDHQVLCSSHCVLYLLLKVSIMKSESKPRLAPLCSKMSEVANWDKAAALFLFENTHTFLLH